MKMQNKILNGGYMGLVALLVSVAIISLIVVRTDLFTGNKDGKNMIEQGNDAIDQANKIKDILEGRNFEGENPEGEADPNSMTLGMQTWKWISVTYNDGTKMIPKVPGKFTLTFKNDSTFSATTDCNSMGGKYVVKGEQITFSNIFSTMMFCEGSQENDFAKILENTSSFFFTGRGELVFDLKFDSGSAIFR